MNPDKPKNAAAVKPNPEYDKATHEYHNGIYWPRQPKNPHAQALGSLGGRANTPAQAKARAANGRKGGRPRSTAGGQNSEQKNQMKGT